jgi:P27 family predicted phage terminase small subunit
MPTPRKSAELHRLQGSVSQANPDKPSYVMGGRPKFPSHLSKAARAEVKRCCAALADRGTLAAGDYSLLAVYGTVWERWIQLKAAIGSELMVTTQVTDNNGNLRTVTRLNPLLKVIAQTETRMMALLKDLGLGPASRDKVKQTSANRDLEVIPGSIAHLYPELVKDKQ